MLNTGCQLFLYCAALFAAWGQCFQATAAQAAGGMPGRYHIEVWQADRGLPQSSVTSIAQTADGYLWVGTQNGLARFDGVTFKVFDENNTPAIRNSRIVKLFEDHEHSLWIGTEQAGVVRYQGGQFEDFVLPSRGTTHNYVRTFAEDADNQLWVLNCEWELAQFEGGRFEPVNMGGRTARALTSTLTGRIVVGTDAELTVQQDEALESLTSKLGEQGGAVEFLARSRTGGCWVAWHGRLRELLETGWGEDLGAYVWTNWPVYDLYEDRENRLWVATLGGGLFCYERGLPPRNISIKDGLPTDFIRCVMQDLEGNIWVGTEGGGLCRLKPALFERLGAKQGLASDQVMSISGRGTNLWVGFNGDGLDRWSGGLVQHFGPEQGLRNGHAWSVLEDSRGTVWVGTWDGLFKYVDGQFVSLSDGSTLSYQVLALYEDSRGDIWVGQQALGALTRLRGDEREVVKIPGATASLDVRAIVEDHEGNLWAGTNEQGLYRRDRAGNWVRFGRGDGLGSESIWSLYVDTEGVLWVGTCRGGLSRYAGSKFTTWTTRQGLINNVICQIMEDDQGNLWLGSYGGVFRVAKRQLNRNDRSLQCVGYTQHDGLPSVECQGGFQPSGWKSADGRLWFPTVKGLAVLAARQVADNSLPPLVIIEQVTVDGESVVAAKTETGTNVLRRLHIAPGRQGLEINYTAICLTAPEETKFKYQLKGLDNGWVEAGWQRVAYYSRIPPGDYNFQVVACNNEGIWNEQGASLAITMQPHVWQTSWFLVGVALVSLASAGGLAHYIGQRRMQRRLELAEKERAVERERARIAQDMHDELGAHLTEIAMLSEFAQKPESNLATVQGDVRKIMSKARAVTAALDEIVWAVAPENDSLENFVSYACSYAESYLQSMRISCRLELPDHLPHVVLMTEQRHNLFLAFKEVLNNAVKHAQASEVRIRVDCRTGRFVVEIRDNGQGSANLAPGIHTSGDLSLQSTGLENIRRRMESIGGHCVIASEPGQGVEVRLVVPLPGLTE